MLESGRHRLRASVINQFVKCVREQIGGNNSDLTIAVKVSPFGLSPLSDKEK